MKKRFIVMLLTVTVIMCTVGCEEPDKCAECDKTSSEANAFLFQHDDGNLYCTKCRDVPVKVVNNYS